MSSKKYFEEIDTQISAGTNGWLNCIANGISLYGERESVMKLIINGKPIDLVRNSSSCCLGYNEAYKLATLVGQPTAGTNGNINPFDLPGGYSISWTGMKVLKHNGSQHHGIGILPDVYVTKTIQGIKDGRDEFLEKAIEIAKE